LKHLNLNYKNEKYKIIKDCSNKIIELERLRKIDEQENERKFLFYEENERENKRKIAKLESEIV
jgi:hypothetical protein